MAISGNIRADNRNHITWTNAERANKAQGVAVQTSAVMSNLSTVSGQQTTASQFHRTPSQTHLAQQHVKSMAYEGIPKALQEAKLSRQAEPLKTLLGIVGKDVAPQDRATFNKICQTLIEAKGNPKKESKVAEHVSLMLFKYGEVSLNKFITTFTEDCREAWRQNHTGFGDNVADEVIFNSSMMACQEVMEKQINFLTAPNVAWINMGQYSDFFEHTCTAVSKTLIHYDAEDNKAQPAADPNNPATPAVDIPDSPAASQRPDAPGNATQYSIPGGPGYGPININIAGPTATATVNGTTAEAGGAAKPATNAFDFGIALTKNPPKNEFEAGIIKDYMNRVLPHVQGVSNSDGDTPKTSTTATQTDITGEMDFASTQTDQNGKSVSTGTDTLVDGDIDGASEEGTEQPMQISTGLLDELLTPPQTNEDSIVDAQSGNGEQIDLQDNSDTESLYDASRQVADALSDLVSELGTPPASPSISESEAFFSDQIQQQQETAGRVAMHTLDGSGFDIETSSQESLVADTGLHQPTGSHGPSLSATETLTSAPRPQFAAEAPVVKPQDANIHANNGDEAQEQPAVNEQIMQRPEAHTATITSPEKGKGRVMQAVDGQEKRAEGQEQPAVQGEVMGEPNVNSATITTPARGKGRVMQSVEDWNNRANGQRQENERLAGQPGSGMNSTIARNNAMGTNINYGKDFFQPLKGMKGTNNSYTSHPVYTTNRTIDPFSRVNAPSSNFVKQFNQFEVNANDQRRLSTGSISSGIEE